MIDIKIKKPHFWWSFNYVRLLVSSFVSAYRKSSSTQFPWIGYNSNNNKFYV